jgi:phosphoribosyl 1,2-cyclic phosphodiesterase
MKLTFYGTRGSCPIARRDQARYGGHTTCLHFRTQSGQDLILDAGSGICRLVTGMMQREFAGDFVAPGQWHALPARSGQGMAHILITHTHWDHILGLTFFYPFHIQGNRFVVVSAGQTKAHIRDILSGQQEYLNWPWSVDNIAASLEYQTFKPGDELTLGEFRVKTVQLNHQGITIGYRIKADGRAVAVYTDTGHVREIRLGDGMGGPKPDAGFSRDYLARLARRAHKVDMLVHDTFFLEHEMLGRYDWGHSTVEDALEMTRMAEASQLVLFHHHLFHSDTVIDEKLALARDLSRGEPFEVAAAADGWLVDLGSDVKAPEKL